MFYDIVLTIIFMVLSDIFFGILANPYLKWAAKRRIKKGFYPDRNDRGSIALVVMTMMMIFGLVSFIIKDAAREQPVKTAQILQVAREIDPNGPAK